MTAKLAELRAAQDLTESALRHAQLSGCRELEHKLAETLEQARNTVTAQQWEQAEPEHSLTLADVEFLWDLAMEHIQTLLRFQPQASSSYNARLKQLRKRMPAGWRREPV